MLKVQPFSTNNQSSPAFGMRAFVIFKPDLPGRNLESAAREAFKTRGVQIIKEATVLLPEAFLRQHYAHVVDKPFFPDILKYMQSTPVKVMVVEDKKSDTPIRELCLNFRKLFVKKGETTENLLHSSGNVKEAGIEIARAETMGWF